MSYALSGIFFRIPLYIWWAEEGPVTTLDIVRPVISFASYGLGLAALFYSLRLAFNLGDNIYAIIMVLMASLWSVMAVILFFHGHELLHVNY